MRDTFYIAKGFVEPDRAAIVALLREYEASLGISLCFQDFEAELRNLPGEYAAPRGQMLLLRDCATNDLVGCVALRPVAGASAMCEMKRLYIRAGARGSGQGRNLALAAMAEARALGYARMCLDTLPTMRAAQALYRSLGFRDVGITDGEPKVLLFERDLSDDTSPD